MGSRIVLCILIKNIRIIDLLNDGTDYLFSSLILSKRIPSLWTPFLCKSDAILIILPCFWLSLAVFFMVSNNRLVKRNWPEESMWWRVTSIKRMWLLFFEVNHNLLIFNIPKWLTAKTCSMLSSESVNLAAGKIPALLLQNSNRKHYLLMACNRKCYIIIWLLDSNCEYYHIVSLHEDIKRKTRGNIFRSKFPDRVHWIKIDFHDIYSSIRYLLEKFLFHFCTSSHISDSHNYMNPAQGKDACSLFSNTICWSCE